jgi:hypothetical protein
MEGIEVKHIRIDMVKFKLSSKFLVSDLDAAQEELLDKGYIAPCSESTHENCVEILRS